MERVAHVEDRRWRKGPDGEREPSGLGGLPYRVRYRTPDGRSRAKSFARKVDADRFVIEVESRKLAGEFVDPRLGKAPFAEVAEEWLGTVAHLKANTLAGYESVLRAHLLPAFGSTPVSAIDTTAVKRFTASMFAAGKSYQTVKNALNVLRGVLATAVESRLITQNPAVGVRLPKATARQARHDRRAERVFLTAAQVHDLADAMPDPFGTLVIFAAYTGLRAGEIAALRVDDLDLETSKATVRRSVAEVHGQLIEGSTKTGEARTVTLPRFLVRDLRQHLAATGRRGSDFLFTSPEGGQLRQSNFYRRTFKPSVKSTEGVPDGLRFHDLRHTCAALLIAQGAHPKAIQERLGHSSIEVTMDTYGHLYESADEALADALEGVHAAALASRPRPGRVLSIG